MYVHVRSPMILSCIGPIQACVRVVKQIWKVALSVFITLFVTLLVFPGLSSDIQDCSISDWPPVINAAVFNVFDMISRVSHCTIDITKY